MRLIVFQIAISLLVSGCGYFSSGTWEDDSENWERAFYSDKPENVVILHSNYSRFSHWTDEFVYFFQIESNEELLTQIIESNHLILIDTSEYRDAFWPARYESPDWFLPKADNHYDVWAAKDLYIGGFRIFQDIKTGTLFLFNRQL